MITKTYHYYWNMWENDPRRHNKENLITAVIYFQSWHMGTTKMNIFILQITEELQKRYTVNDILIFITSYTCYIYPTTMSWNLKRKQCAYDSEFKLKVVQYADNCNNNKQMALEKQVWSCWKPMLDLAEMPPAKKACRRGSRHFSQEERELKD